MNKKTCTVAMIFMIVTLVWLGVNVYWAFTQPNCVLDLVISFLFALAGIGMVYSEFHKHKRRHISDVNKHQIP